MRAGHADLTALGVERGVLRDGDFKIGHQAGLIAVGDHPLVLFRQADQLVLLHRFLAQDGGGGQGIFHLGQTFQHGLPVGRNLLVVAGVGRIPRRITGAAVKQGLRQARADRPEAHRRIPQVTHRLATDASTGAQTDGRQPGGDGHTNIGVGGGHTALGRHDIRAAGDQLAGQL